MTSGAILKVYREDECEGKNLEYRVEKSRMEEVKRNEYNG